MKKSRWIFLGDQTTPDLAVYKWDKTYTIFIERDANNTWLRASLNGTDWTILNNAFAIEHVAKQLGIYNTLPVA